MMIICQISNRLRVHLGSILRIKATVLKHIMPNMARNSKTPRRRKYLPVLPKIKTI